MKDFEEYIINEMLGINDDVSMLSEYLFEILSKNTENKVVINGEDLYTDKLFINKIIIKRITLKYEKAEIDLNKSEITDTGLILYLNIHKNATIYKETLYHELNHALQFYFKNKEVSLNKLKSFKAFQQANIFIENEYLKELVFYFYLENEIDSLVNETYVYILKNIQKYDKTILNDKLKELFDFYLKKSNAYLYYNYLKNYDPKRYYTVDLEIMSKFLNFYKELNNTFRKNNKESFITKFKMILNIIYITFNKNKYITYPELYDKEKIRNMLDGFKPNFDKLSDKLIKKLGKLYDLVLEKTNN